tara:strand:+ start:442 stop:846 length:405 start_codon:yes stop_codon:yes gene_type:complete
MPNQLRNSIVNFLEDLCNKSKISNQTLGNVCMSFHTSMPVIIIIILLLNTNKFINELFIILLILILVSFYILNGCFLSSLERRLLKQDYTIVDIILEILNIKKTNKNRNKATCYSIFIIITIIIIIYLYKFIYV